MKDHYKLTIAVVVSLMAGAIGSISTSDAIPTWYATLEKPELTPPGWVFAPIWAVLYILMGLAAYIVWKEGLHKLEVKTALTLYTTQLTLNVLWSILFFGLRNPLYALFDISALLILLILTAKQFREINKNAALLLMPYLLWVLYAAFLNLNIWLLN
ncbi:MAG: TspO/MBR family protein [Candidatus Altiarchaeota archaeon]|nr:TspO/MBR family protein [Candidatus Altiarchaeota archaeon]